MIADKKIMLILKKIGKLILAICALPFVLLIRILSPFILIRIYVWDISRIAHPLINIDMYLNRREVGLENPRGINIFCFNSVGVANYQEKKMLERAMPIWPFAYWIDKVNRRIPGWERHAGTNESRAHNKDIEIKVGLNLKFTSNELEFGQKELKKLGVPENCPYICFHAREASYLKTRNSEVDWDYHSYRNADISNYLPAVEQLVCKDYYAIRMGRHVENEFKTNNPRIIDYAASGRTDFLDMYLSAHCHFFIAGSDGLADVPRVFKRPVIWIDFIPFSVVPITEAQAGLMKHLFIPKKHWLIKEKRLLTFDELLNTEVAHYTRTEHFQKAGIEVINNTAEEIMDVSIEMEERLNKTWQEIEEDKELQRKFQEIISGGSKYRFGTIGTKFLREHKELLGLSDKPTKDLQKSNV